MGFYQQLFRLDGKVAIVTGAAGILGSEFCKALCNSGAVVIGIDIQEKPLNELVNELSNHYGDHRIYGFVCDITQQGKIKKTIYEIIKQFSKVDILLNNAVARPADFNSACFLEYSLTTWREVMSVNIDGMFMMAQAVGKHMLDNRQGVILQTSSIYSLLAPDHRIYSGGEYAGKAMGTPAVYTTSKAGVIGLTKHLATLWAEHGIRVNALCPGGVASGQNKKFNEKYSSRVPMGRMAKKTEIAGPMLFLVSDAASYITGQVFYVDGGLSTW
ncbi:MAG: short chain dehydrogenase [uncultured bacterium]|nr:MAG: short chain dehydrogenase [uncultured bacterium]OGT47570.1 MAG: hypothetical protein A3E83_06715 [Gammaproteobacteria bacterium RIFCSPHIGHO2_12_FULL_41_20]HLB43549.1 SDR family oxidoreductase [Gammaproteobacteria bacterium]